MPTRNIIKAALNFLLLLAAAAQTNAQIVANYNPNDELFYYEVKMVDEFMERFNDDPNSFLRKVYSKEKKAYDLSRSRLMVSLFNLENLSFTQDTVVRSFFRRVLDTTDPVYLSFTDSNWYAEATCVFLYGKREVQLPVVLHINSVKDKGSKWMICGIGDTVAAHDKLSPITLKKRAKEQFISTTAHATNFVEFHNVLSPGMQPAFYFEKAAMESRNGKEFISLVQKGSAVFQFAKSIRFHFFQAPGWVFTVSQFERRTKNSGWLISDVRKATESDKQTLLKSLLHQ